MDIREKLVELVGSTPNVTAWPDARRRIADHLIANGVTVQEWRPVSEPPEADEQLHFYDDGRMRCITVLAYTEYGRTIPKNRLLIRPTGNEYLDRQVTDGWVWDSGSENVTYWMPLPTPPKGVSEEALPVADEATERSVAVEKTEDQCKPEGFIGHRKLEVSGDGM